MRMRRLMRLKLKPTAPPQQPQQPLWASSAAASAVALILWPMLELKLKPKLRMPASPLASLFAADSAAQKTAAAAAR